ncbi:hypothetical protein Cni_G22462 [Canna indica]|uniref:Ribosomal protein L18 n=1 Tax=Canna indica TaxID=4628 RepID=A0AAQ3KRV9_9LILI|nr:hypothetical protein Cni_G22462 [Canna indica]
MGFASSEGVLARMSSSISQSPIIARGKAAAAEAGTIAQFRLNLSLVSLSRRADVKSPKKQSPNPPSSPVDTRSNSSEDGRLGDMLQLFWTCHKSNPLPLRPHPPYHFVLHNTRVTTPTGIQTICIPTMNCLRLPQLGRSPAADAPYRGLAPCRPGFVRAPVATAAPRRVTDSEKRVILTGMGLVSVFGNYVDAYYESVGLGVGSQAHSKGLLCIKARNGTRKESAKIRNRKMQRKYNGSATKPRLSVFCSNKQLYAMLIDDQNEKILFYASTLQKSIRGDPPFTSIEAAQRVGDDLIKACKDLNISEISSYDRNGFARGERMSAFEIPISQYGFLFR